MNDFQRHAVLVTKLVCGVQPGQRVAQDLAGDRQGQRSVRGLCGADQSGKSVAAHILHDQIDSERARPELQHGHDVRMVNARGELGFLEQLLRKLTFFRFERVVHQLQRDLPMHGFDDARARQIDGGHSAATDRQKQLVAPDALGEARVGVGDARCGTGASPRELTWPSGSPIWRPSKFPPAPKFVHYTASVSVASPCGDDCPWASSIASVPSFRACITVPLS